MSLADFNRDNPFVIIMRKLEDDLYKQSMIMTKSLITISILCILASIIALIFTLLLIPLLLSFAIGIYNVITWREIVTKGEFSRVNKIIYGDEFSAINVNNEKIFEMINAMHQAKGELTYFIKKIYYDAIIIALLLIVSIIIKYI